MFNISIIEDCKSDYIQTKELIIDFFKNKKTQIIINSFTSFPDNISVFKNTDLLFIDMKINDKNGIEFGKNIISIYPDLTILIISNYPQYLIDGYTIHASRYFLKPIDPEIFAFEMDEVISGSAFLRHRGIIDPRVAPYKIPYSEILYIEYLDRKTHIVLTNGNRIETTIPLREWLSIVEGQHFAQPYKCFLVNLRYVRSILAKDIYVKDVKIPLSKHFKKEFITAYDRARRSA